MFKRTGYHRSSWRECAVCHQEFMAYKATVCKPCQDRERERTPQVGYDTWMSKGNLPKELK